jgi:hypothetical protein
LLNIKKPTGTAAADLSKENDRLSALVDEQETTIAELRRQLNEAIIKAQLGERIATAANRGEKHNVPFDQLMSEETFRNWQQFMSEVPRGANGR